MGITRNFKNNQKLIIMEIIFYLSLILSFALIIVLSVTYSRLNKLREFNNVLENQNITLNSKNADLIRTLQLKRDHEKIQTDEILKLKESNKEKELALLEQTNTIDIIRKTIEANDVMRREAAFTIEDQQQRIEQLTREKLDYEKQIEILTAKPFDPLAELDNLKIKKSKSKNKT